LCCAVAGPADAEKQDMDRRTVETGRLLDQVCEERGLDLHQPALYRFHMNLRSAGARGREVVGPHAEDPREAAEQPVPSAEAVRSP